MKDTNGIYPIEEDILHEQRKVALSNNYLKKWGKGSSHLYSQLI